MTLQGMRRDNAADKAPAYILIPSGDRLPEIIQPARALRLVQASADGGDYDPLHRVFDRIGDNQELASCVRGMTAEGLLIYGTISDAFSLSHATEIKDSVPAEEVPVSNVAYLSQIREKFTGSVAHYTGHVRNEVGSIRRAFGGLAEAANQSRFSSEPKLALVA